MTEIYLTPVQNLGKNISHESKIHRKQSEVLFCWILLILLPTFFFGSQALLSVSKVHGV